MTSKDAPLAHASCMVKCLSASLMNSMPSRSPLTLLQLVFNSHGPSELGSREDNSKLHTSSNRPRLFSSSTRYLHEPAQGEPGNYMPVEVLSVPPDRPCIIDKGSNLDVLSVQHGARGRNYQVISEVEVAGWNTPLQPRKSPHRNRRP